MTQNKNTRTLPVKTASNINNNFTTNNIRNFTIIAHIDHGKTTLVDKILEFIGEKKLEQERVTDTLQVEQEKGITIKMQPLSFSYKNYYFNLIDTPGHIDFSYEVSRALKAVEGALLLVDVTKGIQAQTIENFLKAMIHNLKIIPALSKVDMADKQLIQQRLQELQLILDIDPQQVILTSGHTGKGIQEILDAVIQQVPSPNAKTINKTKALVFDLTYDSHLGMIATVRNFGTKIVPGQELFMLNEKKSFHAKEVGQFKPLRQQTKQIPPGSIGYIATGIKTLNQIFIGETLAQDLNQKPIKGYKKPQPMVFASIFPQDAREYTQFKDAIFKLALNDSGLQIKEIKSTLLGRGYRLGCLGTLHLEIIKERLTKEFGIDPIITMPTVGYKIILKNKTEKIINSPNDYPTDLSNVEKILEPYLIGEIITPSKYLSKVSETIKQSRGIINNVTQYEKSNINIDYYHIQIEIPLASLVEGFFNKLLQASKGFASFSYSHVKYYETQVNKVDILVNHEVYYELSFLTHPSTTRQKALKILQTLKQHIPPSIVHIPLQARVGGTFIARETIRAYRKNVTAKLYGGDIRRKLKLLHKQAKLKKKRKEHIKIKIPAKAFLQAVKSLSK